MEEYEEQMAAVERTSNVAELEGLLQSNYVKVQVKAACKLYISSRNDIVIVLDNISRLKDDESLIEVVDFLVSQKDAEGLVKILQPNNWEDLVVYLEQVARVLRAGILSLESSTILRKKINQRFPTSRERGDEAACIKRYLLAYIDFKVNRRPHNQLEEAEKAGKSRPVLPYPEEHREILQYLASAGKDITQYGYDPELHGDIRVTMPVRQKTRELIRKKERLDKLSELGEEALLELLYSDFTIDFAANSYRRLTE